MIITCRAAGGYESIAGADMTPASKTIQIHSTIQCRTAADRHAPAICSIKIRPANMDSIHFQLQYST